MLLSDETSSHWFDSPHCRFAEQRSYTGRVRPHTHLCLRLSHPYLATPGSCGSVHEAQRMFSTHSLVLQQVLAAEHANSEFCPRRGWALAQHCVDTSEVVPCVVVAYWLMLRLMQGNLLYDEFCRCESWNS
jgi:hypothetical protein